jgi:hypothetical protein
MIGIRNFNYSQDKKKVAQDDFDYHFIYNLFQFEEIQNYKSPCCTLIHGGFDHSRIHLKFLECWQRLCGSHFISKEIFHLDYNLK